ncbi:AAA family ATPase [Marichromatium bheemlicum]|uniref:AAA family ATPase n=1 Tax=Marichromatium bheemlicum TaxID=365339 RepID=A0ABX1IC28_9GAMM|nr:AAA family ATPase [Marichromatium bheemlicum]NKN34579.1 AAA family ATPase [Marichromatium bheemlicum]
MTETESPAPPVEPPVATPPRVRVFVSSPSDLGHERGLVRDLILALAREYRPYFDLSAVLWEEEALTAAQSFQAGLVRPAECEIVLVMLWTRLGTPLAEEPYGGMTGTEWEFVDAVEASARAGAPEVLVYRKQAPCLIDVNDAVRTREAVEERQRLEVFFQRHFFNPDGSFKRAFRQFEDDRALRELVEGQLRKLLNRRISIERRASGGAADWCGSPFRPERPFALADEPVFTGRETEVRELIARLERLRAGGQGLLLISGASGVGKSSLLHAGLLPRLLRPFLFAGVGGCRWCAPDLAGAQPLQALADALCAPAVLGDGLAGAGLDAVALARLLARDPELGATQVGIALDRLQGGEGGESRLALLCDPLDPLLASEDGAPSAVALAGVRALVALARSGRVWVIATLRDDALAGLADLPELAALVDADAWYPLAPIAPARIRQLVEIPARVAGIEHVDERDVAARGLVERLESDLAAVRHWPPLLELVLAELHHAAERREARRLAVADYHRLGGLEGLLRTRAERVWSGLDEAARAALPVLCRALLVLEGGEQRRPGSRDGDLATLSSHPQAMALLEALVAARLVVIERDPEGMAASSAPPPAFGFLAALRRLLAQSREEWLVRVGGWRDGRGADEAPAPVMTETESPPWAGGRAVVRLVHPVLARCWPVLRDWASAPEHARALRLRYRLSRQAWLWRRTDCNREYLLGEAGHAALADFVAAHGDELEALERDYLAHSRAHLLAQRRRNRWVRLTGLALLGLLLAASAAAYWAWDASRQATLNLQYSRLKEAAAAIALGNTPEAVGLAIGAAPYLPAAATDTLARAFTRNHLLAMAEAPGGDPEHALTPAFSDDGTWLATLSQTAGARLWRLRDGRFIAAGGLAPPGVGLEALRVSGGGEKVEVFGIGAAGVWRLPLETPRAPDWRCDGAPGGVRALAPDGRGLALTRVVDAGVAVCMVDLATPGRVRWQRVLHHAEIRSLDFSPDGALLVSASRDGRALLLDAASGVERARLPRGDTLDRPANRARFDHAGERVAVASADERVRLYGLDGRLLNTLGALERDGRTLRVHESAVRDLVFSPDDRFLVAVDDAGQVVRWTLANGAAEVLGHHGLSVERVELAAGDEEALVLSASLDKTARLWGLQTGRELAVFSHDGPVSGARFSRDGSRVLTYSARDGSARLWSVAPADGLSFRLEQDDHVWHLALAAPGDGSEVLMATAAFDGRVELWSHDRAHPEQAPRLLRRLQHAPEVRVRRVGFSPGARWLASAGFDGAARVWDLEGGGSCRAQVDPRCADPEATSCGGVHQVLFAPDGRWLLTAADVPETPLRLWDPADCSALPLPSAFAHDGHGVVAAAVGASADGALLVASGDAAGTLRVMRRDPGARWRRLCTLEAHQAAVTDLALAPDGSALASAGEDGRVALVELDGAGCTVPRLLDAGAGLVYAVGFAPDGEALVSAAQDGRAYLWTRAGAPLATLVGHRDRVYSAEFSPDGQWLLTAARDGELRLWRRPRRAQDAPLAAYLVLDAALGGVAYAHFSPDGNSLGAAYWENAAVWWRLWNESPAIDPAWVRVWGPERARLALIREAMRFQRGD